MLQQIWAAALVELLTVGCNTGSPLCEALGELWVTLAVHKLADEKLRLKSKVWDLGIAWFRVCTEKIFNWVEGQTLASRFSWVDKMFTDASHKGVGQCCWWNR